MPTTGMGLLVAASTVTCVLISTGRADAANTRVCVEVTLQRASSRTSGAKPESANPADAKPADAAVVVPGSEDDTLPKDVAPRYGLPLGQRPLAYMKRLLEHFVRHERGFTAASSGCEQTISVELYPLTDGWTAFARYSGTGREERIDRLLPGELSPFAERAVTALLYGRPISDTIRRDTVLSADSKEYVQRIHGSNHFVFGLGTQVRWGRFATAVLDPESPRAGQAVEQSRFFSPVSAFLGYRGRFEGWGLELSALGGMGTAKTSALRNPGGGHVDLVGQGAAELHVLRYFDPRGLTSLYLGAGSTFELLAFQAIRPLDAHPEGSRATLLGGGVDVDFAIGWEFMRASSAQFFLQADVQVPAYVLSNENDAGAIHTWFPSASFKLGVML